MEHFFFHFFIFKKLSRSIHSFTSWLALKVTSCMYAGRSLNLWMNYLKCFGPHFLKIFISKLWGSKFIKHDSLDYLFIYFNSKRSQILHLLFILIPTPTKSKGIVFRIFIFLSLRLHIFWFWFWFSCDVFKNCNIK